MWAPFRDTQFLIDIAGLSSRIIFHVITHVVGHLTGLCSILIGGGVVWADIMFRNNYFFHGRVIIWWIIVRLEPIKVHYEMMLRVPIIPYSEACVSNLFQNWKEILPRAMELSVTSSRDCRVVQPYPISRSPCTALSYISLWWFCSHYICCRTTLYAWLSLSWSFFLYVSVPVYVSSKGRLNSTSIDKHGLRPNIRE